MVHLHPLRAGQISHLFAGQLQARFLADSQHLSNCVNRLNASGISVLIKKRIARDLDRVGQAERTVRIMFFGYPASEEVVAVADAAVAAVLGACEIFRAPQTRERRDELECRSWRERAHGTAYERVAFIFL